MKPLSISTHAVAVIAATWIALKMSKAFRFKGKPPIENISATEMMRYPMRKSCISLRPTDALRFSVRKRRPRVMRIARPHMRIDPLDMRSVHGIREVDSAYRTEIAKVVVTPHHRVGGSL